MKIAFTTLACPDWDIDGIIAAARKYGYDGVDFRGYAAEMEIWKLPEFSGAGAAETARKFRDAGIEVPAMSSSARMFEPDAQKRLAVLEEVAQYAELCHIFSAGFIRIFGGKLGDADLDRAIDESVAALEQIASLAAPAVIAVETHDAWMDSTLLPRVMERVWGTNVCVLWDVHHPYRFCHESPARTYANIGRYTGYTHVKDSRLDAAGNSCYVLPGEGDVPLDEIIRLLRAGGYDGYLTLEWEKRWHPDIAPPEIALPAYASYLRRLAGR